MVFVGHVQTRSTMEKRLEYAGLPGNWSKLAKPFSTGDLAIPLTFTTQRESKHQLLRSERSSSRYSWQSRSVCTWATVPRTLATIRVWETLLHHNTFRRSSFVQQSFIRNCILEWYSWELTKHIGCKSTAITICWSRCTSNIVSTWRSYFILFSNSKLPGTRTYAVFLTFPNWADSVRLLFEWRSLEVRIFDEGN